MKSPRVLGPTFGPIPTQRPAVASGSSSGLESPLVLGPVFVPMPMRSPAVASGIFEGQLIYWAGPIIGAVLAAVLYDQLFLRREKELPLHGAVRPEEPHAKPRKKH